MNLGEKIRQLRVERRLTQEQLAEKLYVSFQTVSKWETGVTSPDLSQIVPLARLFGITTDELFDFNESSEKLMRDELQQRYQETFRTGDTAARFAICETALRSYPDDAEWRCRYAWDVWCNAVTLEDEAEFTAERDRSIELFRDVIDSCDSAEVKAQVKAQAVVGIVQCLNGKGQQTEAMKYAQFYPQVTLSEQERRRLLISCMSGDEKAAAEQEQLLAEVESLLGYMLRFSPDTVRVVIEAIIPDGNYLTFHSLLFSAALDDSRRALARGDVDSAMRSMKKAKEHAEAYDAIDGEYVFTSPLFDRLRMNRADWRMTNTETLTSVFATALDRSDFAPLTAHPDFDALRQ